jgi:hypothetical protein
MQVLELKDVLASKQALRRLPPEERFEQKFLSGTAQDAKFFDIVNSATFWADCDRSLALLGDLCDLIHYVEGDL